MIYDQQLQTRWIRISRHIPLHSIKTDESAGQIRCSLNSLIFYIAKHSTKFRLKSHLDWAWYSPKTLADAIRNNSVEEYYEVMLNHVNSDPNIWKDRDLELELKTHYADRVARCEKI